MTTINPINPINPKYMQKGREKLLNKNKFFESI